MKASRRPLLVAGFAVIAAGALALSGCSGNSGGSNGQSSGDDSHGPITFVQGKDNNNLIRPIIDEWNSKHPKEKVTFKEQSDNADQQHDDLVQHFQAKSTDYDVVAVDVIWTAEFAAKGWLAPLKGDLKLDTSKMLPATVKAGTYGGTLYTAPWVTDGGLLYYRTDLIKTPPTTWDEMMKDCSIAKAHNIGCYAGQYADYEGLTVNVAEAINSAGGTIVGKDGKTPTLDTPEAKKGLEAIVDAFKDGNIPAAAQTYQEEQGRQAFEAGQLLFHRNWPYIYSLASTDGSSKVKGKFAVAPLPGVDGPGASSLGGHNIAVSAYSKHKGTAVDFIKFMETEEIQRQAVTKASNAPALASLYDDPELNKQLPYLSTLKKSLDTAVPRPVSPFYPAITKAIEDDSFAAIKGTTSVDDALSDMQKAIKTAGAGS
ncbi:ABC transporter substrate-binding protein [Gryllotalpicola daejeonensis]|uniref:ABC transporter substrate-binding protein n=1 Tax=Gryllotalpicola daejeonensis TaxID=993087 RepID=A0ABP7ZP51_9MICO